MARRISIGDYHAGPFCGQRVLAVKEWLKYYGIFRRYSKTSFSIGPILFWKEKI